MCIRLSCSSKLLDMSIAMCHRFRLQAFGVGEPGKKGDAALRSCSRASRWLARGMPFDRCAGCETHHAAHGSSRVRSGAWRCARAGSKVSSPFDPGTRATAVAGCVADPGNAHRHVSLRIALLSPRSKRSSHDPQTGCRPACLHHRLDGRRSVRSRTKAAQETVQALSKRIGGTSDTSAEHPDVPGSYWRATSAGLRRARKLRRNGRKRCKIGVAPESETGIMRTVSRGEELMKEHRKYAPELKR